MLWDNKKIWLSSVQQTGGAMASFTLAKWFTSNTSTQYTIRTCAFTANDRMLWTFRMICNNQNAIRKIFPCKHTLLHVWILWAFWRIVSYLFSTRTATLSMLSKKVPN